MGKRADKLILFDIDGTLLDHNHQVPSTAKTAVVALQAAGHTVALATGRSPFMLEQLRLELGLSSYVGFNGQYVVHEGELIYTNPHSTALLRELTAFAAERSHPLVHLDAERMSCSQAYHPYVEQCMSSLRESILHAIPYFMKADPFIRRCYSARRSRRKLIVAASISFILSAGIAILWMCFRQRAPRPLVSKD